ncbi:MAG TPA: plastocyanin/azurin family copper-binding protein [Candidatus Limnocylindrales bacterium]|nr:plastocyanin/azurin family copper-binding protein [Candidatus Limnocylindrales bacterium]
MSRRLPTVLGLAALLTLAACSSTTTSPAGATPVPTAAGASGGAAGGDPCAPSTAAGTVQAGMANVAFEPSTISGKVGDVIAWTNNDSVSHTATLKDFAACTTETLAQGASGGITFTAAGTYAFFCKIHPSTMTGTITITG